MSDFVPVVRWDGAAPAELLHGGGVVGRERAGATSPAPSIVSVPNKHTSRGHGVATHVLEVAFPAPLPGGALGGFERMRSLFLLLLDRGDYFDHDVLDERHRPKCRALMSSCPGRCGHGGGRRTADRASSSTKTPPPDKTLDAGHGVGDSYHHTRAGTGTVRPRRAPLRRPGDAPSEQHHRPLTPHTLRSPQPSPARARLPLPRRIPGGPRAPHPAPDFSQQTGRTGDRSKTGIRPPKRRFRSPHRSHGRACSPRGTIVTRSSRGRCAFGIYRPKFLRERVDIRIVFEHLKQICS